MAGQETGRCKYQEHLRLNMLRLVRLSSPSSSQVQRRPTLQLQTPRKHSLNTSGLTFPMPIKDIPKFEKQNPLHKH